MIIKTITTTIIFFVTLFAVKVNGQIKSEFLEYANYRVVYQMSQQTTNNKEAYILVDTMALDIGDNWSMFYDLFRKQRDSLDGVYRYEKLPKGWRRFGGGEEGLQAQLEAKREPISIMHDRKSGEPYQIFKNRPKEEITTIDDGPLEMPDTYTKFRIVENIPPQSWSIEMDTMTVFNYLCQKATTTFRGRDYIAWFATDLTISEGPWKLYGLPGLILKAYDKEHVFQFEIIGIETLQDKPIEFLLSKMGINYGKYVPFKTKYIGGNLNQWHQYRRERFRHIQTGFLDGEDINYFRSVNPIKYLELEINLK